MKRGLVADTIRRIETWISRTLLEEIVRLLEHAGIEHARRNAECMMCEALQCSRMELYVDTGRLMTRLETDNVARMMERRMQREPLQYILGYTDFFGLRIDVSPDVLIPRPETEQVVEEALELIKLIPMPKVLDIGTGSGCISIAIKHERSDADVYACDICDKALSIAKANAHRHRLVITYLTADVLSGDFQKSVPGPFDLVISNPPYITRAETHTLATEVIEFEPSQALFVDDDALRFYRAISRHARLLLKPSGYLVFETSAEYGPNVLRLIEDNGYADSRLKEDWAGFPRIVSAKR